MVAANKVSSGFQLVEEQWSRQPHLQLKIAFNPPGSNTNMWMPPCSSNVLLYVAFLSMKQHRSCFLMSSNVLFSVVIMRKSHGSLANCTVAHGCSWGLSRSSNLLYLCGGLMVLPKPQTSIVITGSVIGSLLSFCQTQGGGKEGEDGILRLGEGTGERGGGWRKLLKRTSQFLQTKN